MRYEQRLKNKMNLSKLRITSPEAKSASGEISFIHGRRECHTTAYAIKEKAKIKIKIPRLLAAESVTLNFFDSEGNSCGITYSALWQDFVSKYDVYTVSPNLYKLSVGIYYFSLEIKSPFGIFYGYKNGSSVLFSEEPGYMFQLSVSDFFYDEPKAHYGGIIYHIFVDRFCRGNKKIKRKPGEIYVADWFSEIPEYPSYPGAPIKNNYFYGGNLYGICEKLDYIKSLGVTLIYLSPIFESPSNHKYDTADYMSVDSSFGGDEALAELVSEAKKRGISIILDGVFNHTGSDSRYFNKYGNYKTLGAYQSKKSEYYPWYEFQNHPDKYTSWWGIDILPRINPDQPECKKYFIGSGGVVDKYAKIGIIGLRLDVVDELSDSFVAEIKSRLNKHTNSSLLYGEVWEDASNKIAYGVRKQYYLGRELDGVMNYPLRIGLIEFLRDKDPSKLSYALNDVLHNAPKRIRDAEMNIIGTHDTERIITALGGKSAYGVSNDELAKMRMNSDEYETGRRRLMAAYTALATLPGIPSIFYGDEVGVEGYNDPFNRTAFPWGREDGELLSYYRLIGKIRRENKVFASGEFELLHLDKTTLMFSRHDDKNTYITAINNGRNDLKIEFSKSALSLMTMEKSKTFTVFAECSLIVKANKNLTVEF